MNRRDVLVVPLSGLCARLLTGVALAQSKYPERPIRLVIPFPPGGIYDAVGRPWADKVKPLLGTVVVENVGGAGGSLGAAAVARAPADGYTMLLGGIGPLVVNPIAASRISYDPLKDFAPIAMLIVATFAVGVHPSFAGRLFAGTHRLCPPQSRQAVLRLRRRRIRATISPANCSGP